MKRDFDLIRRILLDVENLPAGQFLKNTSYEGYDQATVNEHVALIVDEKIVRGIVHKSTKGIDGFFLNGLTWKGHDFVEASRNETIWKKAKEMILKPSVSITFDLLLEWLKSQAKQSLGLD
jgi:hypothetical protein